MELMQALLSRRSVRSYTSEPVDRATVEGLIRTATSAPSGMNTQPWAFGVIEGAEKLAAISARVKADVLAKLATTPALERYRDTLSDPSFNVFYGAPILVVIYVKEMPYDGRGACAMAGLSLMLAARDAGLGTCWIGFSESLLQSPEMMAELGVPAGYRVMAPIIVGHTTAEVAPTPRNEPVMLFWAGSCQ